MLISSISPRFPVCVVMILLFSQGGIIATSSISDGSGIYPNQTTTIYFEVIPDQYLIEDLDVLIHGTSDEFNGTHVSTGSMSSYVNLTWTHTAGTELTETADEEPFTTERNDYPYYWDYCYFEIPFEWEYERLPTDAMFYVSFGATAIGSFNTTEGNEMFRIYTWLIDSSDDWDGLYMPEIPYTTQNHLYTYDLTYFELLSWSGMVEHSPGDQEDPEDIMRVAVGLAPSESFNEYNDSHPWQTYNGSVSVCVSRVSLVVQLDPEDDDELPVYLFLIVTPLVVVTVISIVLGAVYLKKRRGNQ